MVWYRVNTIFTNKLIAHRLWWQLAILLMVSSISVYVGLSFNEKVEGLMPETTLMPSIFNRKASGLSGLFEIARRAGLNCRAWQNSYRELKAEHGLLFIISPTDSLTKLETEQILNWVKEGNSLVYFDQFNYPQGKRTLDKLGLSYTLGKKLNNEAITLSEGASTGSHVQHLILSGEARVTGGMPIAQDKDGSLLAEVSYGRGRALIGMIPSFCANRFLQSSDNFDNYQFMINWLSTAPGPVFFDERCHGYSNSPNIFAFFLKEPPGLVFSQLLLILAVATAGTAQRFGAARVLKPQREISPLQFVDGLANAYERAKANLAALEIIAQDFKTKLCKQLGLSPHSAADEIAHTWKIETGRDGSNLNKFLADYEHACNRKKISAAELKQYVQKCDELSEEISTVSRNNSGN